MRTCVYVCKYPAHRAPDQSCAPPAASSAWRRLQSLHWLLTRRWAQTEAPPQSMHWLLMRIRAPAVLTLAPDAVMFVDARTPAVLAGAPLALMLTDARAPAVLARVPLPPVRADAAAPALYTLTALSTVRTLLPHRPRRRRRLRLRRLLCCPPILCFVLYNCPAWEREREGVSSFCHCMVTCTVTVDGRVRSGREVTD